MKRDISDLFTARATLCDLFQGRIFRYHAQKAFDLALEFEGEGMPVGVVSTEVDRAAHIEWMAARAEQGQILFGERYDRRGREPGDY